MVIIKDLLEILYYIAFIYLTCRIVLYAKKTYEDQTKQVSTLYLKLFVPSSQLGYTEQTIFLEIYNHGTRPAKNIKLVYDNKTIGTISYIKPNGSDYLPIGEVYKTLGENAVYFQNNKLPQDSPVEVVVSENDYTMSFSLSTSVLFIRSGVLHNSEDDEVKYLKGINETLTKAFACQYVGPNHHTFRDELHSIAENIKAIK